MDKIKEAYEIAVKNLRVCYSDHGIIAGPHQFNDYWARDAAFASFGALELKDFGIVRKQLLLFIHYVSKKNSLLPKKILHTHSISFGSLVRKTAAGHLLTYRARDQNPLFVISAANYIKKSGDKGFAKTHYDIIKKIMMDDFNHDTDRNLLLEQGFYQDWADSLRKIGEILFTNVCHYAGLKALADIAKILNKENEAKEYDFLSSQVKYRINTLFWNGEYYLDSCGKGGNVFSSGGNILAVIWGVASKEQAIKINEFIKKHKMESFTLDTNYPKYQWWQISPVVKMIGLGDYHNGIKWLWLGCTDAVAKLRIGKRQEAKELLTKIAEKISEYGEVYEVYERDGKPVHRLLYKSEHPFAWSSGLFVYAVSEFNRCKK